MLMLKSPLQLHSIANITTVNDQLNQKILGNYQLLNLSITSEDLLHMTLQEPEIYVAMGNEQTTVVENHLVNQNNMKLEAVNQFINRIMLLHTEQFTYQDEVYISSILQKLGIMDVSSFITQIQADMYKNELITRLTDQYFAVGRTLSETIRSFLEHNKKELTVREKEIHKDRYAEYLQNIVYERLHTAECINTVYDYLRIPDGRNVITPGQAKLLPAIMQADTIHLYQLRKYILQQDDPAIWEQHNQYEEVNLQTEEMTQSKIMTNLSAAVLSNFISNETYELISQIRTQSVWMDFTRALFESSLDTMQRFEQNQAEYHLNTQTIHAYEQNMTRLMGDEVSLIDMLQKVDVDWHEQEKEEQYSLINSTILTLLENQNLQQQVETVTKMQKLQMNQTDSYEHTVLQVLQQQCQTYESMRQYYYNQYENREEELSTKLPLQNIYIESLQTQRNDLSATYNSLKQVEKKESFHSHLTQQQAEYDHINVNHSQQITQTTDEINNHTSQQNAVYNRMDQARMEAYDTKQQYDLHQDTLELLHQQQNLSSEANVYNEEEYREYLYQINEKNIEMQQKLQQQHINQQVVKKVTVDRKTAMRNALQALEDPKKVLEEIYHHSERIEKPVSQEVTKLLQLADEQTRTVYEDILGIRSSRETTTEQKLVETSIDTLQKVVEQVETQSVEIRESQERPSQRVFLQHDVLTEQMHELMQSQKLIHEKEEQTISEFIRNHITEKKETEQRQEHLELKQFMPIQQVERTLKDTMLPRLEIKQGEQIDFIHQQKTRMEREVLEEILRDLETQKSTSIKEETTIETEQIISNQIQKTKKEILVENQQIVEEMIHRNLQTNLHSISEQVYRDIEKRLLSERKRRGY